MASQPAFPLLERGVYRAPFRSPAGRPILLAVTSTGIRIRSVALRESADEAQAIRWLEEFLDEVDPPRPKLTLVKAPPPVQQLTLEQLDAIYRDASPVARMIYARKRAKLKGMLPRHAAY
jgi:hypothetical protein